MCFELGKVYVHPNGTKMAIIGIAKSHTYGICYIGENLDTGELLPVGMTEEHAQNWSPYYDN